MLKKFWRREPTQNTEETESTENLSSVISNSLFQEILVGVEKILQDNSPATGSSGRAQAFLQARIRFIKSKGVNPSAYAMKVAEKSKQMLELRMAQFAREQNVTIKMKLSQNIPTAE